jgi:hypothetical protein
MGPPPASGRRVGGISPASKVTLSYGEKFYNPQKFLYHIKRSLTERMKVEWKSLAKEAQGETCTLLYRMTNDEVIAKGRISSIRINDSTAEIQLEEKSGLILVSTVQCPIRETDDGNLRFDVECAGYGIISMQKPQSEQ